MAPTNCIISISSLRAKIASFAVLRQVWVATTAAREAHHLAPPNGIARAWAVTYGMSRLLILVPGFAMVALLLQFIAATGFGVTAFQMFFFAAFAFLAAAVFGLVARGYRVADYYRNA